MFLEKKNSRKKLKPKFEDEIQTSLKIRSGVIWKCNANCSIKNTFLLPSDNLRGWVQKFPSCHTKAAPNGKCREGYIVPSMVRLMYQYQYVSK